MRNKSIFKKFEKIYKETYTNSLRYIICNCRNIEDAEDILQETYLELYKVLSDKKKIINYHSYIFFIAKNKIIRKNNSNQKLKSIPMPQEYDNEEMMDIDSGINLEEDFITKDNVNKILNYINSKNHDTAKIFYLHFILDMSFKEISKELSIKESTVKSNLYRMLKNIEISYLGGERHEN